MKKLLDILTNEMARAFESAGYDEKYAKVTVSNRPDLCQFQCNGAMAAVKEYKKAPLMIAQDVVEKLSGSACFKKAEAVKPGFINLDLDDAALRDYIAEMSESEKFGLEKPEKKETIIVDYGGPNVAKPLHIGHLRAAIIGESVKRIGKYAGHDVQGDIHLGDWGLQMGLIIAYMKENDMDMPSLSELEKIYPAASAKSSGDEDFKKKAMDITYELQHGNEEYTKIWQHIMKISVEDLKKNYEKLNVFFEIWKGESDAQPFIDPMVEKMKKDGFAHESQGALVVDVGEETDTKEIPPCMILKSDNASLYTTTDLATLVQRVKDYDPDRVIYVVDKRQDLHFVQVFRCAKKTGIVKDDTKLLFLGFGTMNGADGKPFKTRAGGVMRLETLLSDVYEKCCERMKENGGEMSEDERNDTARKIALAAIKYGDLSNQASKDYVFDIDKFTSFEGNTGPYILYTIVRIKSILRKYMEEGGRTEGVNFTAPASDAERQLLLLLTGYNAMMQGAFEDTAPHRICAYVYELANAFNHFYHETKILAEENTEQKESYISLLLLTKGILEDCIDVLGFEAPEKM
ncbi:MAG: arginine--tRNA ligase [Lachnospiraceae bacterium]|nr:arginine--tRNA ligase [Lachnospiraceae bacterium]